MPSVYFYDNNEFMVSYPVKEAQQIITKATYFATRALAVTNKVQAIKFIRMVYGTGLFESKLIVETIMECPDALATPLEAEEYKDIRRDS